MNNLDRIAEWRKGCSDCPKEAIKLMESHSDYNDLLLCTPCTIGLIQAIERDLLTQQANEQL